VRKKNFSIVAVFLMTLLFCFSLPCGHSFADSDGGDREPFYKAEMNDDTEKKEEKKTWTHPERWTEDDSRVEILIRAEDISMKSYTLYFKGGRPGDTITVTNPGNCLIGDANIIEFDSEKKAFLTILPRNVESEVFFISGHYHTRGENIPFFIGWKPWATEVKYITGVDIFKE
jgi:hypothetical protein